MGKWFEAQAGIGLSFSDPFKNTFTVALQFYQGAKPSLLVNPLLFYFVYDADRKIKIVYVTRSQNNTH